MTSTDAVTHTPDARGPFPSETADRFQVRLPDGLRDQIRASAKKHNRSMNSEIVARLDGGGMSLRDCFAGQALDAVVRSCGSDHREEGENLPAMFARRAYELADAMIAERSK